MRSRARVLLVGLVAACSDASVDRTAAQRGDATGDTAALQKATSAGKELGSTLRSELMQALAQGEPASALEVCSTRAQAISAEVGQRTGVRVGRSSLRLRNPANAAPEWVKAWLDAQGERAGAGVTGFSRVDDTATGRKARFLAPIVVEGPCVACHGPRDAIGPRVIELLGERYPDDAATGYAAGDLRGALWAEADVP